MEIPKLTPQEAAKVAEVIRYIDQLTKSKMDKDASFRDKAAFFIGALSTFSDIDSEEIL